MQAGRARKAEWILEWEPGEAQRADALTGWAGSGDTNAQIRLVFPNQAAAVAYAEARGIDYQVEAAKPAATAIKPKVYADNFKFGRSENWSH
ncbi:MAG: NADH-ubiquinone oxidoreductase 18 kDa subunit -like protein [Rhodospirillales bacterium]|nr:NADH-ubiquinone oxidoreductase 18 kDa subunit -like protein [Rhodospirillales bacterium]MDB5382220.1 NADH-ubiquinone oxidoreductase 18 kDa subunit -like protein [Rhodospirillales bacterium]